MPNPAPPNPAERGDESTNTARLKLSARNQLRGKVISFRKGAVNAEVNLRLAGGQTVTAVITNESVDRLEFKEGDEAVAVFKSSNVILAVKA